MSKGKWVRVKRRVRRDKQGPSPDAGETGNLETAMAESSLTPNRGRSSRDESDVLPRSETSVHSKTSV